MKNKKVKLIVIFVVVVITFFLLIYPRIKAISYVKNNPSTEVVEQK